MGLPQRAAQSEADNDPTITVEDWFDDEQSAPWCVDNGAAIQVMSTRSVYASVENGELSPDMKVWRDGRACWLPIAECYELTVKPEPQRDPTPVSGIRRVRIDSVPFSPHEIWSAPTQPPIMDLPGRPQERPALMLAVSFAIGIAIGALLYLPFAL